MIKQFFSKLFNLALVIGLVAVLMLNNSIWLINWALSGATTPGQSVPGSNDIQGYFAFLKSSSITRAWAFDCLASCQGN